MAYILFDRLQAEPARPTRARPVLQTNQQYTQAISIFCEQTGGVQKLLNDLTIGGELDFVVEAKLPDPKCERVPNRFRRERRADGHKRTAEMIGVRHRPDLLL